MSMSRSTYSAIVINIPASKLVKHPDGYCMAVVIPNQEVLLLKPSFWYGYLYTFSPKLSEAFGWHMVNRYKVYRIPIEFQVKIQEDPKAMVEDLKKQWYKVWKEITNNNTN